MIGKKKRKKRRSPQTRELFDPTVIAICPCVHQLCSANSNTTWYVRRGIVRHKKKNIKKIQRDAEKWNEKRKIQSKKGKCMNTIKARERCSWSTLLYSQARQFLCWSTRVCTWHTSSKVHRDHDVRHSLRNTWGLVEWRDGRLTHKRTQTCVRLCGVIHKVTEAMWSPSLLQNERMVFDQNSVQK